jgi:hypothetical protein
LRGQGIGNGAEVLEKGSEQRTRDKKKVPKIVKHGVKERFFFFCKTKFNVEL